MRLQALVSVVVLAVAFTLENVALATAVVSLLVAGAALLIVNLRLGEFQRATEKQSERLDLLERRAEPTPSGG